jgi:hypothetical protein
MVTNKRRKGRSETRRAVVSREGGVATQESAWKQSVKGHISATLGYMLNQLSGCEQRRACQTGSEPIWLVGPFRKRQTLGEIGYPTGTTELTYVLYGPVDALETC